MTYDDYGRSTTGQFVANLKNPRIIRRLFSIEALGKHRKAMLSEGNIAPNRPVFCDSLGGYLRRANVWHRHFTPIRLKAKLSPSGWRFGAKSASVCRRYNEKWWLCLNPHRYGPGS